VSFHRPLLEPCPECGGVQVDMGRGRTRCLKHEGPPPRFAARERADDANGAATVDAPNGTARPRSRATKAAKTPTIKARAKPKPNNGTARVVKAVKSATRNGKAAPAKNGKASGARNGAVKPTRRTVAKKA
jgi:hypothetical protein